MQRSWLTGTALAAVLTATPALAQTATSDFGQCALNEMTNDEFLGLELDNDPGLTMDEYNECLSKNSVTLDDGQKSAYDKAFTDADENADGVLVFAEVEAYKVAAVGTSGGTAAQVKVEQATPDVAVSQAAPTVTVDQAKPTVEVAQSEPTVDVTQQQPQVEVQQAEPTVSVEQAEPTVEVEQPEAQVAVSQPEPQVQIDAPAPEVEVRQAQPQVEVKQAKPEVSVSQPEPEVSVEQADANVEINSEEPKVVVNQAEPEVVIEKVTESDASDVTAPAADTTASATTETQTAMADTASTDAAKADVVLISFDDVEGEDAFNTAGEELGEVSDIVMEKSSGDLYAVVSAGGFLGIGEESIVFPYSDVSIVNDQVVIDTTLTADTLEERTSYDENLFDEVPEDRIVR